MRVIAHIDLDAFYAQCEGVRLGLPEDQPLAVQVSPLVPTNLTALPTVCTAMARLDSHQLSCPKIRVEQAHHNHRSEKVVPSFDRPTCGYVERG